MMSSSSSHKLPKIVATAKSQSGKQLLTNMLNSSKNLTTIKHSGIRKPSCIHLSSLPYRQKNKEIIKHGVFRGRSAESSAKIDRTEEDMDVEFIINEIKEVREQLKSVTKQDIAGNIKILGETIECCNRLHKLQSRKLFVVVDTNVFIDNIEFLHNLVEKSKLNPEILMLVIPWVVLHELDCMKDNKHRTLSEQRAPLQQKARVAIRRVSQWLESRHPCVTGQLPADSAAVLPDFIVETNDDRVLQCCLQFARRYPVSEVALLTMDRNLRNKAMVMHMRAHTVDTLSDWLNVWNATDGSQSKNFCNASSPSKCLEVSSLRDVTGSGQRTKSKLHSNSESCQSRNQSPSSVFGDECGLTSSKLSASLQAEVGQVNDVRGDSICFNRTSSDPSSACDGEKLLVATASRKFVDELLTSKPYANDIKTESAVKTAPVSFRIRPKCSAKANGFSGGTASLSKASTFTSREVQSSGARPSPVIATGRVLKSLHGSSLLKSQKKLMTDVKLENGQSLLLKLDDKKKSRTAVPVSAITSSRRSVCSLPVASESNRIANEVVTDEYGIVVGRNTFPTLSCRKIHDTASTPPDISCKPANDVSKTVSKSSESFSLIAPMELTDTFSISESVSCESRTFVPSCFKSSCVMASSQSSPLQKDLLQKPNQPHFASTKSLSLPEIAAAAAPTTASCPKRSELPNVAPAQSCSKLKVRLMSCLEEGLSKIIESEMKAIYGDDIWKDVVFRKPPWTAFTALECLNKHWIAVFSDLWPRRCHESVKTLMAAVEDMNDLSDDIDVHVATNVTTSVKSLFNAMKSAVGTETAAVRDYASVKKMVLSTLSEIEQELLQMTKRRKLSHVAENMSSDATSTVRGGEPSEAILGSLNRASELNTEETTSNIEFEEQAVSCAVPSYMDDVSGPCAAATLFDSSHVQQLFQFIWQNIHRLQLVYKEALSVQNQEQSQRLAILESFCRFCRSVAFIDNCYGRALQTCGDTIAVNELARALEEFTVANNIQTITFSFDQLHLSFNTATFREILNVGQQQLQAMMSDISTTGVQFLSVSEMQFVQSNL